MRTACTGRELKTRISHSVPALSEHYGANKSKLYDRKEEKKKSNKYYLLSLCSSATHAHSNPSIADDDDENKIIPKKNIKRSLMISDKLQSEQKNQWKKVPFESGSD